MNGRRSAVYSYWPACRNHEGPRSQTFRQNGVTAAIAVSDSGHSVQGDQPHALVEILRGVLD